jgi:hypothetical protein
MVYDPHASALFQASGPVDSVDPSVFAFTMNLIQWTSYASHGVFPLKIYIAADSKWKSNRVNALPKLQRVVTLTGTMPVLPNSAESKGDEFCITVTRDLEYVGWTSPNPPGPAPPSTYLYSCSHRSTNSTLSMSRPNPTPFRNWRSAVHATVAHFTPFTYLHNLFGPIWLSISPI